MHDMGMVKTGQVGAQEELGNRGTARPAKREGCEGVGGAANTNADLVRSGRRKLASPEVVRNV